MDVLAAKSGLPDRIIADIGELSITEGRRTGEKFEVLDWQERFIRGAGAAEAVQRGCDAAC